MRASYSKIFHPLLLSRKSLAYAMILHWILFTSQVKRFHLRQRFSINWKAFQLRWVVFCHTFFWSFKIPYPNGLNARASAGTHSTHGHSTIFPLVIYLFIFLNVVNSYLRAIWNFFFCNFEPINRPFFS